MAPRLLPREKRDEIEDIHLDCRRAIEIAGGLPLTIRGALFAEPGPDPVANFLPKEVFVTQLEVKQGRWIIGNIGFTRSGQDTSPSWRETSLRTTIACMPRNNRTSTRRVRLTDQVHNPFPSLSAARHGPGGAFWTPFPLHFSNRPERVIAYFHRLV